MKKIKCTHYDIKDEKLPRSFSGYKIAMLSDLHDNIYGISLTELYEKIDKEAPDCIVFAGDLITRYVDSDSNQVLDFVDRLAKKYRIYFSNGNHESRVRDNKAEFKDRYERVYERLIKSGVIIINNERVIIERNGESINMYGLELEVKYFRKFKQLKKPRLATQHIEELLGAANEKEYNMLIAHTPMFFKQYVQWGADVVFSGHIHGGIIRLPLLGGAVNTDFSPFPKYDGGLYRIGNAKMIVGKGLGTHTINIRINNPPELVIISFF